jgi:branched-chain amino acid transport system ATP-binding protein
MLLQVENLSVAYSGKTVLHGISMHVEQKQVVGLIGHNGAGKSTSLKAIMGTAAITQGKVIYEGKEVTNRAIRLNLAEGIAYVPQGAPAFWGLTVTENLALGAFTSSAAMRTREKLEAVFGLFPDLCEKRNAKAESLSGGQRQMLSIGRGLMLTPKLLLIDEPSGGLSPLLVERLFETIVRINRELETAILLVEENLKKTFEIVECVYVLRNGKMVFEGEPHQLADPQKIAELFMGS